MRLSMVCLFLFSFAFAILTIVVDGGNASSGSSNKVRTQPDDRRVICNVIEDSHSKETIKSLETTLEKQFEKLIAALNKTTQGNNTGELKFSLKQKIGTENVHS